MHTEIYAVANTYVEIICLLYNVTQPQIIRIEPIPYGNKNVVLNLST